MKATKNVVAMPKKRGRPSAVAKDLRTPKYKQRVVKDKRAKAGKITADQEIRLKCVDVAGVDRAQEAYDFVTNKSPHIQ